ncbi:hypothetical protein SLS63_004262 [Diaporthe eres]|uniref:Uncharacterized protein n=1 Tax=Diaporthe eres TaxID=83184 RepID=A0ABR1PEB1_DIAER
MPDAQSFETDATDPIAGSYTFHDLCIIIGSCTSAFTILSVLTLMYQHATHFSNPNEQLKILRISALLPVTSTIMLVGILVPKSYFYIHPWADVMQALALGNFFLLMLEFVSPHNHELAVVTDITQIPSINVYCADHNKPQFAHIWSLKGLQIVFNIVEGLDPSPLEPDNVMSEADVVIGAHATLNCIIMVGFSIFFHYAYSVTPYIIDKQVGSETGCSPQDKRYLGGFLGVYAWIGMLNLMEVIAAAASIFNSGDSLGRTTVIECASDDRQRMKGKRAALV